MKGETNQNKKIITKPPKTDKTLKKKRKQKTTEKKTKKERRKQAVANGKNANPVPGPAQSAARLSETATF